MTDREIEILKLCLKMDNTEEISDDKEYTCECKYYYDGFDCTLGLIGCQTKDEKNIRLCKLATKMWADLLDAMEDHPELNQVFGRFISRGFYATFNTTMRAIVFKTLAEEANAEP